MSDRHRGSGSTGTYRAAGTVLVLTALAGLSGTAAGPEIPTATGAEQAIRSASGSADGDAPIAADTVVTTPARAAMSSVTFSPHGERVVSSGLDGRVYLWDAGTGEELRRLDAHRREAYAVAFSPDGERLATAGYDGAVRVWDPDSGRLERSVEADPWALDLAFAPGGGELLVGEVDGDVVVHPLGGGPADTLPGHDQGANAVAWHPDGGRLATAFSDVHLTDAGSRAVQDTLRGHAHVVLDLAFTPDGRRLISGSTDASIRVWDLERGAAADTLVTDLPAPFLDVSPDGRRLAAGGAGRSVRVWRLSELEDGGQVVSRHEKLVTGVAFSPCGDRVASSGLDGRVRIVRLEDAGEGCP